MKAFVISLVATIVLGLGAAGILRLAQREAYEAYTTQGARVGDPGENLVGKNWNGLNAGPNVGPKAQPHG